MHAYATRARMQLTLPGLRPGILIITLRHPSMTPSISCCSNGKVLNNKVFALFSNYTISTLQKAVKGTHETACLDRNQMGYYARSYLEPHLVASRIYKYIKSIRGSTNP